MNFLYQTTMLAQTRPCAQTLQAPLWRMAGPGQKLSISSLAATMDRGFRAVLERRAAMDDVQRAQEIEEQSTIAVEAMKALGKMTGASVTQV